MTGFLRTAALGRFAQRIAETREASARAFDSDSDPFGLDITGNDVDSTGGLAEGLTENNRRFLEALGVPSGSGGRQRYQSGASGSDYGAELSRQMSEFVAARFGVGQPQQQPQQRPQQPQQSGQPTEGQHVAPPSPASNATLGKTDAQSNANLSDEIEEVFLGITGNTGRSTGPHLDIRYGRNYDPTRRRPEDEHLNRIMVDGKPLSQWTITSEHRSRNPGRQGHDGIDYGTPVGRRITTTHRIRRVSNPVFDTAGGGYYTSVEFEDGVTLNLLHLDPSTKTAGVGTRTRRRRSGGPSGATTTTGGGVQARQQQSPQQQTPQRGDNILGSINQAFEGGQNSLIVRAVGHSEGNRDARGGFTRSYRGHRDPGNRAQNIGSFSYQVHQGGASTPEQADQLWLGRIRSQVPRYEQAARRAGLNPSDPELLLNFADLYTQSPAAATERGGFLDRLPEIARSQNRREAILQARVNSYINPRTGRLDAPGFNNDRNRLTADQQRRKNALYAVLAGAGRR